MSNKIGAIIALDGEKEFKAAVTGVNKELSKLKSESALVQEEFKGQENTVEALRKKHEVLQKTVDAHKKKEEEIKKALENARTAYEKVGNGLNTLRTDYDKAREKMERMKTSSETTDEELEEQQKTIDKLAEAIKKGERNYTTAANRVDNWEVSLNNATAQTIRANRELEQIAGYLEEAENSADGCASSIDEYGRAIQEQTEATISFGSAIKVAVAEKAVDAFTDLAKTAIESSVGTANEMTSAANQIQASTGIATDAMEDYKNVMKEVYADNYGENFEDVGEAIQTIAQNLKDVEPSKLKETAENVITLRDTFGFEYQEQIRAVKMLMDTFGISSQKAFNLIAQGAQKGLNKNDDLLDTINEYSVHYKQMGVDADGFFNSLTNGAAAGTFSIDKLGDAYKEFGIRVKDTASSTTEGFELIGMDADAMRERFAAGGESAKAATAEVLDALFSMEDQVKQNQAGVDLFGTMWEDLGIEGVKALTNVNGEISTTHDVMESIQNIKYSDTTNQLTQLARTFQMKIAEPIEKDVLPKVNKGIELVGNNLEEVETTVIGLGTAIALYKFSKTDVYVSLASTIGKVATATRTATGATKAAAAAQALWNAAMNMSPIGIMITAITAVTAGLVLYKAATKNATNETKQAVDATKEFCDAANDQIDSINNTAQAHKENVQETQAHWEADRMLIEQLYELNNLEEKSSGQKAVMKGIVNELADDIPELAAAFDEESGSISMTRDELEKLIDKNEDYYLMIASQDALTDYAKNAADAQIIIKQTEDELDKLRDKFEETGTTFGDNYELIHEGGTSWGGMSEELAGLTAQYTELMETRQNAMDAEEEAKDGMKAAQETVESYKGTLEGTADSVEDMSAAEEQASSATQKATEEQQQAYQELKNTISDSLKNSISLMEEFSGGEEISAKKILENLESQINGMSNWADNMEELAGAAGYGMTEEFYNYLAEMGPQSANLVQTLVDSLKNNKGQFAEICKDWTSAMDLEGPLSDKVSGAYQKVIDETENFKKKYTDEAGNLCVGAGKRSSEELSNAAKTINEQQKVSGQESIKKYSEGVASQRGELERQVTDTLNGALNPARQAMPEQFYTSGTYVAQGLAKGMRDSSAVVASAARDLANTANTTFRKTVDINSPSKKFAENGKYISEGVAVGIRGAKKEAEDSIVDLCNGLEETAKGELEIHSPSKRFKEKVGKQIARGVAFGVTDEKGNVAKEMEKFATDMYNNAQQALRNMNKNQPMYSDIQQAYIQSQLLYEKAKRMQQEALNEYSKNVYKAANAWFTSWKKTNVTKLEDEKFFWKKVLKTTTEGTEGYASAYKKLASIKEYEKATKNQLDNNFWISEYTESSTGERTKKKLEDYYSEIYSAASKYIDNYSVLHNVSLQEEEDYWKKVQKKMQKGTQGYIDATKKLKEVQSGIKENVAKQKQTNREYGLSGSTLDVYKTYYNVSAKAEMQYWDLVRKKTKKGTAEQIEADQKYYEAKQNYNDQLKELNDDYYQNCKDVKDKLKNDIEDLQKEYKDTVADRKNAIASSFNLFDEFESKSSSGKTLLYNLKSQVAGIADWEQQLDALGKKGILSDGLMKELQEIGPGASASIHALNQLSESELREYQNLYDQKNALAESQAVKENEDLRKETQAKIKTLKEEAQKELDEYKKEYDAAVKKIKKGIEKPLKNLAKNALTIGEDAAISLVTGIGDGAEKKSTDVKLKKVNNKISKKLGKLPAAGKKIGKDTLQGILDGLYDEKSINSSAKNLIDALKKAMQKAADIHSPSRLFKREVGKRIGEGTTEGIIEETKNAEKAGSNMIRSLLEKQQEELQNRQNAVKSKLEEINDSARIAAANQVLSTSQSTQIIAQVDNSDLISMFGEMIAVMQQGFGAMANTQIVTDTGTLIGETSRGMSEEFAMMSRRTRR